MHDLYAQFLEHVGLRSAIARDGEEGLKQARALQPAVIVLDLGLPKIDGCEVVRRLKADPKTSRIPVVVVSGHAQPEVKKQALEAGVAEFCVKPCPPATMVDIIRRHLR